MMFLFKNRLVPIRILAGVLLMLGTSPGPSEGLKCYSCEGGSDCLDVAYNGSTRKCGENERGCFLSGLEKGTIKRDCYSTAKTKCIKEFGTANNRGDSCYDPLNSLTKVPIEMCITTSNKEGETSDTPPSEQGSTCVCAGELCNDAYGKPDHHSVRCYMCNGDEDSDCNSLDWETLSKFGKDCGLADSCIEFNKGAGGGVIRGCSPVKSRCWKQSHDRDCLEKNEASPQLRLELGACALASGSRDPEVPNGSRQGLGGLDINTLLSGDFHTLCICDMETCNGMLEPSPAGKLTYNIGLIVPVALSLIRRDL